MKYLAAAVLISLFSSGIASADQDVADKYPESVLYDAPREVIPGVWSAIGATAPPTYENSGHNNNLSFIITPEGVVVVNAGACYLLAKALHEEIRRVTDQPVKYVILENGQGHAALGSNYWQEQGAQVIAHVDAAEEIEEGAYDLLARMQGYNRDKAEGTEVVMPDITFEDQHVIELGGMRIEALYLGPSHSPGDIQVWLPQQRLVISGDMAFHERLLPIFDNTDTKGWLETYEIFIALDAQTVIPGHGVPTTMDVVTRYTRDYLVFLRGEVQKLLDEGGTLDDAYKIDQSAYSDLDTFDELAARNAGRVFEAMEFE
jgi:glyoxylase-like metal-dependent hydrolase (beta-lactamase superfamily II)